jgi:hypothetical protein
MSGSGRCGHFSAGALSRAWLRVHGAGRGRAALLSDAEKMLFDVLSERVAAATDGDPAAAFASSCGRVRKSALYCPRGITTTRPMPASPTGKRSRRAQIRYLPMRWTRPRSGPLPPDELADAVMAAVKEQADAVAGPNGLPLHLKISAVSVCSGRPLGGGDREPRPAAEHHWLRRNLFPVT